MKVQQRIYMSGKWKTFYTSPQFDQEQAQLVLCFGAAGLTTRTKLYQSIKKKFPQADVASTSTAGEIIGSKVHEESLIVTALQFEKTTVRCSVTSIKEHSSSYQAGKHLMNNLFTEDLASVFVMSDGTQINGSELVAGFNDSNLANMKNIPVTGGLAGDGAHFQRTYVGLNQVPQEGIVVAIGFYGSNLKVGHGSFGGWEAFGPARTVSRSEKNILYEIDGKNALDLYRQYLGPYQEDLPASALLFPLSVKEPGSKQGVVRTILGINDQEKCMFFAGNIPQSSQVRLMRAGVDKLINGSSIAAQNAFASLSNARPDLILLISCVGRKLVLQQRIDQEIEAVKNIFGGSYPTCGFYSYGEISPFNPLSRCELHNQTMTITTFAES